MADGFEVYERQRVAPSAEPVITIQKKGIFRLNRAAYDAVGAPEAVELLYNRDKRLIAMRKAKPGLPRAFALLTRDSHGDSWYISGRGFLRFYGIEVARSVRRQAHVENGMLVIDLNDPGTAATAGRQKA
jgi:hypothetical protein